MNHIAMKCGIRSQSALIATINDAHKRKREPKLPFLVLRNQTEKDEPQPQVLEALGFLMTNCAPSSPSE